MAVALRCDEPALSRPDDRLYPRLDTEFGEDAGDVVTDGVLG